MEDTNILKENPNFKPISPGIHDLKSITHLLTQEPVLYSNSIESDVEYRQMVLNSQEITAFLARSDGIVSELCISNFTIMNSFKIFKNPIKGLKISKTGSFLVLVSEENSVCVWNLHQNKSYATLDLTPCNITTFDLTADEKVACIGGSDCSVHIWFFQSKSYSHILIGHVLEITSIKVLSNSKVLSSSKDKTIKLWNLEKLNEEYSFEENSSIINCIELSNNSSLLASGSSDSTVKVWELESFKLSFNFDGHTGEVYCLAFCSDNLYLASGSQDKTVRVMSLKTGDLIFLQDQHENYVLSVIFHNSFLISVSFTSIFVCNFFEKRTEVVLEGHKSWIQDISILKKQNKLISASIDKTCKLWDLNSEGVKFTLKGHSYTVTCLAVSKDNKFIVSGGSDHLVNIWCLKYKKLIHRLEGHKHNVSCVDFTNNCTQVISTSWDGTVKIWNIYSGTLVHSFESINSYIFRMALSSNDKSLITTSGDYFLRVWDIIEFKLSLEVDFKEAILGLVISKDSKFAYAASLNSVIMAINLLKLTVEKNIKASANILGMCFSKDQSKLLICLQNSTLESWDLKSFSAVKVMSGHNCRWPLLISCADFQYFAVVSEEKYLKIWNYCKGEEFFSLKMSRPIESLKTTNLGNFVVCGMSDGDVVLVNIKEKRIETRFKGHSEQISSLATDHRDKYIISGSKDFSIKVWKMMDFEKNSLVNQSDEISVTTKILPLDDSHLNHTFAKDSENFETNKLGFMHYNKIFPAIFFNGFRQRLYKKSLPFISDCSILLKSNNLAHIYCMLGLYSHLERALAQGCQIRRNFDGRSPMFYAILKNSEKCIEVMLKFMISLSTRDDSLNEYIEFHFALRDDFFDMIQLSSQFLPQYLDSMFIVSKDPNLPNNIRYFKPPCMLFSKSFSISFDKFKEIFSNKKFKHSETFVVFRSTPFKINLTPSSRECFNLLNSLIHSKNPKIFNTHLVKTLLDFKFKRYKRTIYLLTFISFLNLIFMLFSISAFELVTFYQFLYLSTTFFQLLHEILQLFYEGLKSYITTKRNLLDVTTLVLSFTWISTNIGTQEPSILMWLMVFFNSIAGLKIFKAFDATRFYISLLSQSIKETYSFLVIFAYSTFSFGALYVASVGVKYSVFNMLWKTPYEMNFGIFRNSEELNLEYLYFILGSFLNIVLMLNLLIAILGDSFDRFQMIASESDYVEKLDAIIEVESIFAVFKGEKIKGYAQICDVEGTTGDDVWGGKIKEIEVKIEKFSKEIHRSLEKIDRKQNLIEEKIDRLISRCEGK